MVEYDDKPALICQQCVKDLFLANVLRKKCLQADEYFHSTYPEKSESEEIKTEEIRLEEDGVDELQRELNESTSQYPGISIEILTKSKSSETVKRKK